MNARIIGVMGFAMAALAGVRQRSAMTDPPVAFPGAGAPPEWRLREELRFGDDPGADDDLAAVRGLVVAPSSTVYALGDGAIKVFRAGTRPRTLNLPGAAAAGGAGPVRIGAIGDDLWVLQPPRLLTVIDTAGRVVRRISYPGDPATGPGVARELLLGDSTFISLLADGSFLRTMAPPGEDGGPPPVRMYVLPLPVAPDTSVRATALLVRAAEDGEVIQGLEVLTSPWSDARVPSPFGDVAVVRQPFQDHPLVATSPDGREVVVVDRYAARRPGRATYAVIRFHGAGWKRTVGRFQYDPAPIHPAEVDSAATRVLDGPFPLGSSRFAAGFPSRAAALAAVRAVIRPADWHAPVTDVIVGTDRTVWLRDHGTGRWVAHGPGGLVLGAVTLPYGARLVYASERTLWVVTALPGGPPGRKVLVRYRVDDA